MNIPVELIIWIGGGNMLFLSICVHVLISIARGMQRMQERQIIIEYRLGIAQNSGQKQVEFAP